MSKILDFLDLNGQKKYFRKHEYSSSPEAPQYITEYVPVGLNKKDGVSLTDGKCFSPVMHFYSFCEISATNHNLFGSK